MCHEWYMWSSHILATHHHNYEVALGYSHHYKSNYYTSDKTVNVGIIYYFNTGLEMHVCVCVYVCMGAVYGSAKGSVQPRARAACAGKRWMRGQSHRVWFTSADWALTSMLSHPCHRTPPRNPIIHDTSSLHKAGSAIQLRMMGYAVSWIKAALIRLKIIRITIREF